MSLVGVYDAEWRKRPINLFRVFRSFIVQLTPGQEITKVALPSELMHPFSMLELIAYRELQLFHLLFEIEKIQDPKERLIGIVKWYMGIVRAETMEKKPFNPVIGETHICWLDHGDDNISEFIGEQVSHHPPISAFVLRNKKHGILVSGSLTFSVGFGSNSAAVRTGGAITIETRNGSYFMSKCMPDMNVNNVIWGEKYLMWVGTVKITCSESSYSAEIALEEQPDQKNVLSGNIFEGEKPILEISGVAGGLSFFREIDSEEEHLLIDISLCEPNKISYLPEEAQDEWNSLKLWHSVKEAIIKNDMPAADEIKKQIEASQRARENARKAEGEPFKAQFFEEKEEGIWKFKENIVLDSEYFSKVSAKVEQVRAENQYNQTGEPDQSQSDENEDDDSTCNIQ